MGSGAEATAVEAQGNGSIGGSSTPRSLEPGGLQGTLADIAQTGATAQQAAAVVGGGSSILGTLLEADEGGTAIPTRVEGEAEAARRESNQGGGGGGDAGVPPTILDLEEGQPWTWRDTGSQLPLEVPEATQAQQANPCTQPTGEAKPLHLHADWRRTSREPPSCRRAPKVVQQPHGPG